MLGATPITSLPIASPPIVYRNFSFNPKVLAIFPSLKDIDLSFISKDILAALDSGLEIVLNYASTPDIALEARTFDVEVTLVPTFDIEVTDIYAI